MGSTILRREVLLPRQAPCEWIDLRLENTGDIEARTRAAITRALWTSVALAGIANCVAHMLGTWL